MEIILATGNKNKIREIKEILKGLDITILSITDFADYPKTIEDGETIAENAVKKAKEAALFFKKWAMADDTGLEVEYLNGAPGVYSARYAGKHCSYKDNNEKLLRELKGLQQEHRKASFKCVIALSSPEGLITTVEGQIDGLIAEAERGQNGFGYDAVFFIPQYGKTFAELDGAIKNKISHRGQAVIAVRERILSMLAENAAQFC
ncbi:MAG: XTP/dITP diphosphatase [Elusimicrobiota bacterium]|jgi:XTP/dITP diphosphohydrolase|nr:XTP/dITP diphosphatase [Elusimicrobiota bacterium]